MIFFNLVLILNMAMALCCHNLSWRTLPSRRTDHVLSHRHCRYNIVSSKPNCCIPAKGYCSIVASSLGKSPAVIDIHNLRQFSLALNKPPRLILRRTVKVPSNTSAILAFLRSGQVECFDAGGHRDPFRAVSSAVDEIEYLHYSL